LIKLQELQSSFLEQLIPFEESLDGDERLIRIAEKVDNTEEGKTAVNTLQQKVADADIAVT
jgi:hypothetical protein